VSGKNKKIKGIFENRKENFHCFSYFSLDFPLSLSYPFFSVCYYYSYYFIWPCFLSVSKAAVIYQKQEASLGSSNLW